jgi:hypothetical protein
VPCSWVWLYKLMRDTLGTEKAKSQRTDSEEAKVLKAKFRNAIFSARRRAKRAFPSVKTRNDLAYMMALTGYRVPEQYGINVVGKTLTQLREHLNAGCAY